MPGPSDGDHCERDRLFCTNTVSGCPLRIVPMPDSCQPSSSAPATPVRLARERQRPTITFITQLCGASKSDGPLL